MNAHDAWSDLNAKGARYFKLRDYGEAARVWQRVIDSGDPDAAPIAVDSLASLKLFVEDQLDEAEAGYVQAIASGHPNASPRALAGLAEVRLRQGSRDEAESLLNQAARLRAPGDARAAEIFAIVFGHLDRLDEAAVCYVEMSADPERRAQALLGLGWIHWRQGQSDEAKNLWRQVIVMQDGDASARASYNLGAALQADGLRREAVDAYRQATESPDPDLAEQATAALKALSFPRRALTTFLPVAVFVLLFLPHGWLAGVGYLLVVGLIVVLMLRRRDRREIYIYVPIVLVVGGIGIADDVYGDTHWPAALLIAVYAVLATLFVSIFALPAIRTARSARRSLV